MRTWNPAEIMINLVSAVRGERHSQTCATCGIELARLYNITAEPSSLFLILYREKSREKLQVTRGEKYPLIRA